MNGKPRLILDGAHVSDRELQNRQVDIRASVMISPGEVLAFSTEQRYENWMLSSPLTTKYTEERKRREQALNIIEKVGKQSVQDHFNMIHTGLKAASNSMNAVFSALSEEIRDIYGLHGLYKILLSSRVGTVEFYRDVEYYNGMLYWEGIFQISSPYVGDENNDTLSSIRVLAPSTAITICEHAWWGGRIQDFWAVLQPIYVPDFSTYPYFPNDTMSSYWFWLGSI